MKKSFVFLLLALALVVIVSPGIVGKLAEQSMDANLDWAAAESREFMITSQGFDRGWFSSEGQHRIELRDGDVRAALAALFRDIGYSSLPALIIDTRIDHGLVPVSSMTRDRGSLAPGLGSAVSSLRLEFGDGDTIDLPGTIYSKVSLAGELQSNVVVAPGTFSEGGETLQWGNVDAHVVMHPSDNSIGFDGTIDNFALSSPGSDLALGTIVFDGEQQQTRFGFSVGEASVSIESITYPAEWGRMESGPLRLNSVASLDNDLVSGRTTFDLEHLPLGELGPASVGFDISFQDVDAAAISRISAALDNVDRYGSGDALMAAVDEDLARLLAAGFGLRIDRLDIAMPPGTVSATLDLEVEPTTVDRFVMTSLLLAVDAELDLSVPVELYDYAVTLDPQVNAAVGMGFLRREGDEYRMRAEFRNGLLTVNGAPMPGIIPGLR